MKHLIENQATMFGNYDGDELTLQSTVAETTLVSGLTAIKTANKSLWAGGTLLYTITIVNDTGIDFENPTFLDTLDNSITIVPDTVKVGGIPQVYTFSANTLSVGLDTIAADENIIITFEVMMV